MSDAVFGFAVNDADGGVILEINSTRNTGIPENVV